MRVRLVGPAEDLGDDLAARTDGEVARMNLRFSTFGKKLDVYCDYLTSILLVFGEFVGYSLLNPTPKVLAGSLFGIISLFYGESMAWLVFWEFLV